MHVLKLLHKRLENTCSIHKKRLACLFEIVETAMNTQPNKKIHKAFLKKLKFILPINCQPIIITDAGFRNSWFKMVEALG